MMGEGGRVRKKKRKTKGVVARNRHNQQSINDTHPHLSNLWGECEEVVHGEMVSVERESSLRAYEPIFLYRN